MADSPTYRHEQIPLSPALSRARTYARAATAARPAEAGDCRLYSLDWWLVCLAVFAMIFVRGGDVSVLAYLGAGGWIIVRNPALAWRTLARCALLLLVPALALMSTLWSDQPSVSLKQSAELMLTMAFAIAICGRVRPRELAAAALFAGLFFCLLSLAYQRNALSAPLVGLMGSKNQMAFVSEVLMLSALAVIIDARNGGRLRLLAVAGAAVGALGVVLAQSAGIWVTSAAATAALVGLSLFSRIGFSARVVLVVLGLLAVSPLAFAFNDVEESAQSFQTQVLHKDATLTGRTELWTAAQSVIAESPALGHGYNAFWQQGNPDAEALWQTNGIASRTGFNFHNQFLDAWVDLGEVGVVVLAISLVYIGLGSVWRAVRTPSISAAFMTSLLVALYLRLPVESTLVGAWNAATFLWVAVGVGAYGLVGNPAPATSDAPGAGRPSWRESHERLRTAVRPQRPSGSAP